MAWPTNINPHGANHTPALIGISNASDQVDYPLTIVPVAVDPTNGALLVETASSEGGNTTLGIYNTTLPTLTNAETSQLQLDSNGRLLTNPGALTAADDTITSYQGGAWTVASTITSDYPAGAVPLTGASGNVANSSAVATLTAVFGKTTYITGFEVTSSGATVGAVVTVTVTGTITGTLTYIFSAPAGVLLEATPLIVEFGHPIPASATATSIVVTLPALGTGNTNASVVAHGYNL